MSRVIVHRSEWAYSSQSKNKTQAEDGTTYFTIVFICLSNLAARDRRNHQIRMTVGLPFRSSRQIGVE
jgi:hypothetical protein